MRDEKEERKKQARSNKQTRQSNTAHPTVKEMYVMKSAACSDVLTCCVQAQKLDEALSKYFGTPQQVTQQGVDIISLTLTLTHTHSYTHTHIHVHTHTPSHSNRGVHTE